MTKWPLRQYLTLQSLYREDRRAQWTPPEMMTVPGSMHYCWEAAARQQRQGLLDAWLPQIPAHPLPYELVGHLGDHVVHVEVGLVSP